ncbi:MAG: 50S ribosomal protein L22 [Anaerolineales bacterium]|nr:MAG: 50S ribosomal protein L22 [Anaerolineales bacterium]
MGAEVLARAKHVPMPARKVRRVVDRIRGLKADEALELLHVLPHAAALPVAKLIRSAIANAEENFGMSRDGLYVAKIAADDGPGVMPGKGWRRRFGGRGRSRPIRKRSSHLTVVLEEKVTSD